MNIFFPFLLKNKLFFLIVINLILCSCASSSSPGTPGFQKEYPWTFVPYTNAPWTSIVSFNDFIDLEPFYLSKKIKEDRAAQDIKYGYPINSLSQSLLSTQQNK